MTIYDEGRPKERDTASTHTAQFLWSFTSFSTALQKRDRLGMFLLTFQPAFFGWAHNTHKR